MRVAVTVAGPMPSPRKKMTFLASPSACAAVDSPRAARTAIERMILRMDMLLEAHRGLEQAIHGGVGHETVERLGALADGHDRHVGAAVGLATDGHLHRGLLVVVVRGRGGLVERGR